jgi:hypothetical protein
MRSSKLEQAKRQYQQATKLLCRLVELEGDIEDYLRYINEDISNNCDSFKVHVISLRDKINNLAISE